MKKMRKAFLALLTTLAVGIAGVGLTSCGFLGAVNNGGYEEQESVKGPSDFSYSTGDSEGGASSSESVGSASSESSSEIEESSNVGASSSEVVENSSEIKDSSEEEKEVLVDGILYKLLQNDTYEVVGVSEFPESGEVEIPAQCNGKSVTSIGVGAFKDKNNLIGVKIPDSVTNIDSGAFSGCYLLKNIYITDVGAWCKIEGVDNLMFNRLLPHYLYLNDELVAELEIPDTVEVISEFTFCHFDNLKKVKIGNGVTEIKEGAFYLCEYLENVELGTELAVIDEDAFNQCGSLKEIAFPGKLRSIGERAFYDCGHLKSLIIPESLMSIGEQAFYKCEIITDIYYEGDVASWLEISGLDQLMMNGAAKNLSFENTLVSHLGIPEGIKSIQRYAFYKCTNLQYVEIPETVEVIEESVFSDCENLEGIALADGLKNLENDVFYNTAYYKNAENWENNVLYIGKYLIKAKTNVKDEYTIKDGTLLLANFAFSSCSNLTGVVIPESLINVGYNFEFCSGLANIEVSEKNATYCDIDGNLYSKDKTTLVKYAIGKTETGFIIPDGVTSIWEDAFYGCTNLTSVVIPIGVTRLGDGAFYECENLTTVYYRGVDQDWKKIVFGNDNYKLKNATRYYYSETEPTADGNWWHYVDGVVTVWE